MAILLVEVHQVHIDETIRGVRHCLQGLRHSVGIALRFLLVPNAPAQKDIEDFAYTENRDTAGVQLVQKHVPGWRHSVVMAVRSTCESAWRSSEGPSDHTAHLIRAAQNLTRGLADFVELPQW